MAKRLTWDEVSELADKLEDVREELDAIRFPDLNSLDMPLKVRRKMLGLRKDFNCVCSAVFDLQSETDDVAHDLMGEE
jgi:hypothetical protein